MHLLMICASAPTPERPRAHGLLTALARQGYSVTLLFADRAGTAFDSLTDRCRRVVPVRPRQMAAVARAEAASGEHTLAHIDGLAMPLLRGPLLLPAVIDITPCTALRRERAARAAHPALRAARVAQTLRARCWPIDAMAGAARLIAATPDDAWAARTLYPSVEEIAIAPSPVDLERFAPPLRLRDPATLLLDLRGLDQAEAAAALGAAEQIMAQVWAVRSEARLRILGRAPFGAAGRLAAEQRVEFTGLAREPQQHLAAATLVLAPIAPGGSPHHSALEAMATGVALICRPELARELGAAPGYEVVSVSGATAMARAALSLLDDPPYRGAVGRAGRHLVERRHNPIAVAASLDNIYAAAAGSAMAEWRLEVGLDRPREREP